MADVQVEKGHIRIANPVMEALALAPFNGGQVRVLLAILRATWGWQRKEAELSTADLAETTGMARSTAAAGLRALVDEGVVIEVHKPSFSSSGTYRPQKDPTKWGRFTVHPPALSENSDTPKPRTLRTQAPETPEFRTGDSEVPDTKTPEAVAAQGSPPAERQSKDRKDSITPDADGDSCVDPPRDTTASDDLVAALEKGLDGLELDAAERKAVVKEGRRVTSGLDYGVWNDPKGTPAPEVERPRLLQLAVLHWDDQDRKIPLRSCLRYVIAQQLDPFELPSSEGQGQITSKDENKHYRNHQDSAAKRTGSTGPQLVASAKVPEPKGGDDAQRWAQDNPEAFERIKDEIAQAEGIDRDDQLQRLQLTGLAIKRIREEKLTA